MSMGLILERLGTKIIMIWEKYLGFYALLLSLMLFFLTGYVSLPIIGEGDLNSMGGFISIVITVFSIILGFLGVTWTILMSLQEKLKNLWELSGNKGDFSKYYLKISSFLKKAFIFIFLAILADTAVYLFYGLESISFIYWIALFINVYGLMSFIRFSDILFRIQSATILQQKTNDDESI